MVYHEMLFIRYLSLGGILPLPASLSNHRGLILSPCSKIWWINEQFGHDYQLNCFGILQYNKISNVIYTFSNGGHSRFRENSYYGTQNSKNRAINKLHLVELYLSPPPLPTTSWHKWLGAKTPWKLNFIHFLSLSSFINFSFSHTLVNLLPRLPHLLQQSSDSLEMHNIQHFYNEATGHHQRTLPFPRRVMATKSEGN